MMWPMWVVLLAWLGAAAVLGHGGVDHTKHGYRFSGPLDFECQSPNGTWSAENAPRCVDQNNRPLSFRFGVDAMMTCMMRFSAEDVKNLIDIMERRREWICRVRMTPGHDQFHIPFTIPVWGVIEASHIHINSHLNFVFHALQGSLIAATAYPLRDQFTFLDKKGGTFNLHGHVKFFQGESFSNLNSRAFSPFDAAAKDTTNTILNVIVWALVSFVVTLCGALLFFFWRLKPDIIAKTIREKGAKAD